MGKVEVVMVAVKDPFIQLGQVDAILLVVVMVAVTYRQVQLGQAESIQMKERVDCRITSQLREDIASSIHVSIHFVHKSN